jgi:hypothetical protein
MADLLRKASGSTRAVPTTLSLAKANGSTTAELTVATGWNTTTDLDVIIYRRQLNTTTGLYEKVAGTQTEWVADSLTGTTLSGMALRAGTEPASGYAADGNTVVMCGPTSAYADDLYTWGNSFATPQGTLRSSAVQTALGISGGAGDGWSILNAGVAPVIATGYNKGNKEFDLPFNGVDLTGVLSPGMKLKFNRSGTTPTQCTDLESTSSQYAAKASPTGITFTDDFTVEAWIKLESIGTQMTILSRRNSGATSGWQFYTTSGGQLTLAGWNGANFRTVVSYNVIPLNQWVHVAATLDMSAGDTSTSAIYVNGATLPRTYGGTATSLTQPTDNLILGAVTGVTDYFDGEVSDARLWSTIRTATQIRDNMHQQLTGSETGLVGYWKLNGNFNDSTSNANNLTASGGAVATTVDNPMNATEYVEVIKTPTYSGGNSTVKVMAPTGYSIPNMTLTNPYYSTHANPFGWPDNSSVRRYTRSVSNPGGGTLTNISQDLANLGLVQIVNAGSNTVAQVRVDLGVGGSSDFEFYPQVKLGGVTQASLTPSAAPGIVNSRATERGITWEIPLAEGANTISAGVQLAAGGGYVFNAGAGVLTVTIVRGYGTGC